MNRAPCPSPEELQQLHAGTFPEASIDEVTAHLDDCPDCQELLASYGSSWLAALNHTFCFDQESEYQQLEEWLLGLRDEPSSDRIVAVRDYQLLERVGQGGMGVAYKARHTKMDRLVAIKLLSRNFLRDPQAIARFERETRTAGLLDHPHIVRAFDAGEVYHRHFLVLEYLDGKNISEIATEYGPISIANASEIIRQTALGVQYAHEKGLVHRDLKPSNLMLVRPSVDSKELAATVKILDYGLSQMVVSPGDKITGALTDTGQIMGTLEYMAPEQCKDSRDITPQADLYSLGATLYKLLTGQAPYSRDEYDSFGKLFQAKISDTPQPVQSLRAEIPKGLADIVDQLLSMSPASRPTAEELAEQLVPFTEGHNLASLLNSPTVQETAELALDATEVDVASTDPDPLGRHLRFWNTVRTKLALELVLGLLVLGIVLVIRTPDGKEDRQEFPDGTEVTVITSTLDNPKKRVPSGLPPAEPNVSMPSEPTRPAEPQMGNSETDSIPPAIAAKADPDRSALLWMFSFKEGRIVADIVIESGVKVRFEIINRKSNTPIPDEPFELVTILFYGTKVEDADLWRLRALKQLKALLLSESHVTAAGLRTLRELPLDNISWWQGDTGVIRPEDIAAIVQFKKLERLSLMGQKISGEILKPLENLPVLWQLGVFNCGLEPDAMEALTGMTTLREINMYNSTFHDSFIPSLAEMPSLRSIHTTQLTERMMPLSQKIPKCRINCKGTWLLAGKIVPHQSESR